MTIFPLSSRDLPVRKKQPPVADLRREITAWRALVWAYADENVRAATHCGGESAQYCSNGLRMMRIGETGIGRGTINGLLDAHPDACAIDNLVANWFDEWPMWRQGVAVYAEKRMFPPSADLMQTFTIVGPVLNAKGRPKEIWHTVGRKDHPYLCPLEVEGFPREEIERHRQFMALFDAMLEVMMGLKLTRWRIVSKGA